MDFTNQGTLVKVEAKVITNPGKSSYYKLGQIYYKLEQELQIGTILLQFVAGIANGDSYYKFFLFNLFNVEK